MSYIKASNYLKEKGYEDRIIIPEKESSTVALAAIALGVPEDSIAKSLSFLIEDKPILIVVSGNSKIDNKKYRDYFHIKAKMIPYDEVEKYTGHYPGGVCPFGIDSNVDIYLDVSLKRHDILYPACGDDHSAVKLTLKELEELSNYKEYIDVCKEIENA